MSIEHALNDEEQLSQLQWYFGEHHPQPDAAAPWGRQQDGEELEQAAGELEQWAARLPDRLTHTAMMLLGSALDHTMPGHAWIDGITATTSPYGTVFTPTGSGTIAATPTGRWGIALHGGGFWRGDGASRDHAWHPEVAALAQLTGITILDVDYPLYPTPLNDAVERVREAAAWAREQSTNSGQNSSEVPASSEVSASSKNQNSTPLAWYGASAGAALALIAAQPQDRLVATRPLLTLNELPDAYRRDVTLPQPGAWPTTLIQQGSHDTRVQPYAELHPNTDNTNITVETYVADHMIIVPTEARRRHRDAATHLRA